MNTVIVLVVIAVVVLFIISIYNKLIELKNRNENAFAQIEVQLKRRYDLIPNLIETAKAYLKHESETLQAVVAARNSAQESLNKAHAHPSDAQAISELNHAEQGLAGAIGKLNIVMEDYPDLKANENMMQVHEELTSTENKISFARQAYNDSVMAYNTYRQSFPQVIFAANFGHPHDAMLLEFADSTQIQEPVKVAF